MSRTVHLRPGMAIAGVAIAGVLAASCQGAGAQEPPGWRTDGPPGWQVGNPIRESVSPPPGAVTSAQARADTLAAALGLAGRARAAVRERDIRSELTVDEVTLADAAGKPTARMTFDAATGAPVMIVRLDRPDAGAARVDAGSAPGAARSYLGAAGMAAPAGSPRVRWDPGLESWTVGWERTIGGVPAPGDGTFVDVLPGGEFAALSVVETRAAIAPAAPITAARAREAAVAWAAARGLTSFQGFSVAPPALEWRQANDFVEPARPDSPEPLLRLVYAVVFSYVPRGEESPRLLVLYVDASSGALIGGAETA
jgi:hypothetical protein